MVKNQISKSKIGNLKSEIGNRQSNPDTYRDANLKSPI